MFHYIIHSELTCVHSVKYIRRWGGKVGVATDCSFDHFELWNVFVLLACESKSADTPGAHFALCFCFPFK